uniref:Predicted protein n=1 Tax=Hordeum vulgare subsp. vulgare TaxID=112509 RepID=F2DB55_HORVV|nr:predicted protein [Hordeum vulgare subsp. vulgare]
MSRSLQLSSTSIRHPGGCALTSRSLWWPEHRRRWPVEPGRPSASSLCSAPSVEREVKEEDPVRRAPPPCGPLVSAIEALTQSLT